MAIGLSIDALQELTSAGRPVSPGDILAALNSEIARRRAHPRYDLTKIAVQAWAEAAGSSAIGEAVREGQERAGDVVRELVRQWAAETGAPVDPDATAGLLTALVPGLILAAALGG